MAESKSDEKKDPVVEKVRPLSQTAARNLEKLINNDFDSIRAEMREMNDLRVESKTKEMRAGASIEVADDLEKRAIDLVKAFNAQREALIEEARRARLTLHIPTTPTHQTVSINDDVLVERINKMTQAAQVELRSALNVVRKKENEAVRRVWLASITADAEEVLRSIPTAEEMMLEAAADRSRKELEAQS